MVSAKVDEAKLKPSFNQLVEKTIAVNSNRSIFVRKRVEKQMKYEWQK